MNTVFETVRHDVDLCVVGGGMAGTIAAIAAARHGIRVALMQDRPMLGGNASSEIRMWIGGAHGRDNREGGILEEIELENFYRNPGHKFSIWDTVVYEKAMLEPGITLLMNCSCLDADMRDGQVEWVLGWQTTTQTYHKVYARIFADCSGDSVLAPLTGAEYRYGREARAAYDEPIAPIEEDRRTMGMSILFQTRETDSPKPFIKPDWAYTYDDADIPYRPQVVDGKHNFWWMEVGGEADCIRDTEELRDELLKIAYGVWDHMKNRGDHGVENHELDWIGMLPGKRESRRYVGGYVVCQSDVEAAGKHFPDIVAYGGWSMDDHFPAGIHHLDSHPTIYHPAPSPWGIPYRALYSRNIPNLMFAGRNISTTHTAMSSSRVMATCALVGQAVGTAAACAVAEDCLPDQIDIRALQVMLMEDDCWLPYTEPRPLPALTREAEVSHPVVLDGVERGDDHLLKVKSGETVSYTFAKEQFVHGVRLVFDSDFNRNYHNMPCCFLYGEERFVFPATMVTDFTVTVVAQDGSRSEIPVTKNRRRLVRLEINKPAVRVELSMQKAFGTDEMRLFSFEVN